MATILYVEDNDDNMFIVHRRLTQAGFEVAVARNGQEGVTMARQIRPDLIVMDLDLPVIDGWEATRRLKGHPETKAIPIIALTAHDDARYRDTALAAGCDDFEGKPVDFRALLAKIRAHLGRTPGAAPRPA